MMARVVAVLCAISVVAPHATGASTRDPILAMHVVASNEYLGCEELVPICIEDIRQSASLAQLEAGSWYAYIAFIACYVDSLAGFEFAIEGWPQRRSDFPLPPVHYCPSEAEGAGQVWKDGARVEFPCAHSDGLNLQILGYFFTNSLKNTRRAIVLKYTRSQQFGAPRLSLFQSDGTEVRVPRQRTFGCTIGGRHHGRDILEWLRSGASAPDALRTDSMEAE